ncbi:MAG: thioredoxin-disulfide reductase [Chloroflexota bacterium]
MTREYEVIIIGGGPAGLSAGIYTARSRLSGLLIEKAMLGGLIANAEKVENYPGFPDGVSGLEIGGLMQRQASKFGLETVISEVQGLTLNGELKTVKTSAGNYTARAVIVASGSEHTRLDVPGEEEFTGKGVSFCATCDGYFFQDKTVAIVGGGNAALSEALLLTKFANKVFVVHRRNELRATRIVQEKALAEPKIEFRLNSAVSAIEGNDFVERLKLRNLESGETSTLKVNGVFIAVGFKPSTDFLKTVLPLDSAGYIVTNEKMETEVPGIFAAGDVRSNSIRQVIAAAGDGATAAIYAEKYLGEHR